jgi:hypothetical protein
MVSIGIDLVKDWLKIKQLDKPDKLVLIPAYNASAHRIPESSAPEMILIPAQSKISLSEYSELA